jgi:hypothetical protein
MTYARFNDTKGDDLDTPICEGIHASVPNLTFFDVVGLLLYALFDVGFRITNCGQMDMASISAQAQVRD